MNKHYDIIIIGAGPAGIFTAYELVKLKALKNKKMLIIEQGLPVEKRFCPIERTGKCLKCKPFCKITSGFSGSGAFSDGKLTLPNMDSDSIEVGGELHKYLGIELTKNLMMYADSIYLKFGADTKVEGMDYPEKIHEISENAKRKKVILANCPIRHLGTEKSHILFEAIQNYLLKNNIEIMFETNVLDLISNDNCISGVVIQDSNHPNESLKKIYSEHVVLAVGRKGATWLKRMCKKHNIMSKSGAIDIGVRYELSDDVMSDINKYMYEGKFIAYLPPYKDKVRTFCQNPSGFVTNEVYDNGLTLVNGHSFKNKKSHNTNLALLVSHEYTSIDDPIKFGMNVAENINKLGNGNVLVQRLEDIWNGKRTWDYQLLKNSVVPTLKTAVAGDITSALSYRTMTDILTFIKTLDEVIPGFACPDNLLYAAEVKFYSNQLLINNNFETNIKGLYSIGDGGGLTRGLIMASASGIQMARILKNIAF